MYNLFPSKKSGHTVYTIIEESYMDWDLGEVDTLTGSSLKEPLVAPSTQIVPVNSFRDRVLRLQMQPKVENLRQQKETEDPNSREAPIIRWGEHHRCGRWLDDLATTSIGGEHSTCLSHRQEGEMLRTDDQERTGQDGSRLQWTNQTRGQMVKDYVNGKKARACKVHVCVGGGWGCAVSSYNPQQCCVLLNPFDLELWFSKSDYYTPLNRFADSQKILVSHMVTTQINKGVENPLCVVLT
jgi:hypothetical protein